jgi:hypothetical protein
MPFQVLGPINACRIWQEFQIGSYFLNTWILETAGNMKQFIGLQVLTAAVMKFVDLPEAMETSVKFYRSTRRHIPVGWNNREHLSLQKSELILWNKFDQSCRPLHWMRCIIFLFVLPNINIWIVLNNVIEFFQPTNFTLATQCLKWSHTYKMIYDISISPLTHYFTLVVLKVWSAGSARLLLS